MVLYHAVTNYHILSCIIHKITYNPDADCMLYISNINNDKVNLQKNIVSSSLFTDVRIINEFSFHSIRKSATTQQTIQDIHQHISSNEICLTGFDDYYICGDHYCVGMYLTTNQIKYNYFEEACGILSKSDIVKNNIKNFSTEQYELIKELNLFGESDVVVNRFGDLSKQVEGYYNEKDTHFSISEILQTLSKNQIAKIIGVFQDNVNNVTQETSVDLLLTQHFINLGFMTYDEQKLLYTLLVDYFGKNNQLIIKPHPSDIHGLYKQWFPNSIVLNKTLPSELLPYITTRKFETGITASSTAVYGLSESIKDIVCFDNQIEKEFLNINTYYIALLLLKKFLHNSYRNIYLLGCYQQLITNLAKTNRIELPTLIELSTIEYPENSTNSGNIFIIDNLKKLSSTPRKDFRFFQNNLKENDIVIYINSNNKQYFYNEYQQPLLKDILTVVVNERKLTEGLFANESKQHYLFVYCTDNSKKEIINTMSEKIILKNSGIELEINQKDRIEIKTLEGILLATESRLDEEIKISKSLRKELSQLKKIQEVQNKKLTQPQEKKKSITKRILFKRRK